MKIEQTKQWEIAEVVITEVKKDIDSIEDLSPALLLDMMGVVGVEFAVGEGASLAFIGALEA